MTSKSKHEFIGKDAYFVIGGVRIGCTILDYKFSYGHDRWLVKPLMGGAERWVQYIEME
jgi:hypothetical protein